MLSRDFSTKLSKVTIKDFILIGITKNGHALTVVNGDKILVKKKDYNILLQGNSIEGAFSDWNDIKMFKTLQF